MATFTMGPNQKTEQYLPPVPSFRRSLITIQSSTKKDETKGNHLEENGMDHESLKRRFGWSTLQNSLHVPFIYRSGEKYCPVRIVNKYILETHLHKINENVYCNCTSIVSYYITKAESNLLNEINEFHCDHYFGSALFTMGDVVVRLDDAIQFYEFLLFCNYKLVYKSTLRQRAGFLCINHQSIVPYVTIDDRTYLPFFYFEGIESIHFTVHKIAGWDLSYLKFCFKVQGIREEFFSQDECDGICIDEVKKYFEPNSTFKEWWPSSALKNTSLVKPDTFNKSLISAWYQPPLVVCRLTGGEKPKEVEKQTLVSEVDLMKNMYYVPFPALY